MLAFLPGNVPANKAIWVLGDRILNEAAGHYQKFKPKPGEILDDTSLYLERKYDLKRLTPGMYGHDISKPLNVPAIIMENFVDALNLPVNEKVPDTIVILWNDHRFWNDELFLQNNMSKILHKFIKEIRKISEIRNFALPEKAANWDNPRLFITRPLPMPNGFAKYPPHFKSNRRKLLKLLHKSSKREGFTAVNFDEFSCDNKNGYFNSDGTIAEEGYNYIWMSISNKIQEADREKEKLCRKLKAKQLAGNNNVDNKRSSDSPYQKFEIDGVWNTQAQGHINKQSPARRSLDFTSQEPNANAKKTTVSAQSHHAAQPAETKKGSYNHHKGRRG